MVYSINQVDNFSSMLKCISLLPLFLVLNSGLLCAQSNATFIDWQQWEDQLAENDQSKTLVYVYTSWCTLCKKLEQEAFADSTTRTLLLDNFALVGLDAESKEELQFQEEDYSYVRKNNMGYHELAAHLLDGRLAFPSLVFLDEESNVIQVIHGYQGLEHFNLLVRYYGEDHYKNMPWRSFQRQYGVGQITDD